MKTFRIAASIGLILFSLIACGVAVIAIVDPVGAKMADDGDPFGTPPSRLSSFYMLWGFIGVGAAGIYLIRKSIHAGPDSRKPSPHGAQ